MAILTYISGKSRQKNPPAFAEGKTKWNRTISATFEEGERGA